MWGNVYMLMKRRVIRTDYIQLHCDKCGEVMKREDYVLTSHPVQYPYVCKCGHRTTSTQSYPKIDYVLSDELEDVEDA